MFQLSKDWKLIARIGKARGLTGSFYIIPEKGCLSDEHKELRFGKNLADSKASKVLFFKKMGTKTYTQLKDISDRNQVEELRGYYLWGRKEVQDYPYENLLSARVIDKDQKDLGEVHSFKNYGGIDNLVIKNALGHFLEIPFHNNYFEIEDSNSERIKMLVKEEIFSEYWYATC